MDNGAIETLPDAVVVDEEIPTSSAADEETPVKAYVDPIAKNFELVDFAKKRYKCAHCDWVSVAPSSRRRLEHLLAKGGGAVRACVHAKEKLSEGAELHDLQTILDVMNNAVKSKRKSSDMAKAATESLTLPKRQRKIHSFINQSVRDKIDLGYARMVFMSAVKSTFLDSPFTKDFFMVSARAAVCVCVCACVLTPTIPSRPTLRIPSTTPHPRERP